MESSVTLSGEANARVDEGVGEVDDEVDRHQDHRRVHRDKHDYRYVLVLNGVECPDTETGETHHALKDDRPAEQATKLQSGQRQDGRQGVAKGVADRDHALVEAFGASGSDVVLSQDFEEA